MSSDKYIHIYIDIYAVTTKNQGRTFSSLENISMCPLQPVPSSESLATICHHNFVFSRIHVNGTVEYLVFCVLVPWFFHIMLLRFTDIVCASVVCSFLLMHSIVFLCMDVHSLHIHSPADGHLGGF